MRIYWFPVHQARILMCQCPVVIKAKNFPAQQQQEEEEEWSKVQEQKQKLKRKKVERRRSKSC